MEFLGLKEKEHYTIDKNENRLFFSNWSEIIFTGLDDISKVKGMELWFLYVDEVDEVGSNVFSVLSRRLRNKNAWVRKGFITSNSEWKNWTYQTFVRGKWLKEEYRARYYTVRASSLENSNLPEDYIDDLLSYTGDEFRRYVLGDFNVFEGQIFDEFDEMNHIVEPFDIPESRERVYGHDHGLANPTAFIEAHIDFDENIWITWEHYVAGKEVSFHADALLERDKALTEKNWRVWTKDTMQVISDPSIFAKTRQPTPEKPYVTSVADEYLEHEIVCQRGNNSVLAGINRIKYLLKNKKIFVFSTCTKFIEEIQQYRWKRDQDNNLGAVEQPVKKDDHSIDAFRYMIMAKSPPPEITAEKGFASLQQMMTYDIAQAKLGQQETQEEDF